jgi:hypothetical protein
MTATNARYLERRAPELMQNVINGKITFREAARALADRPDGPPFGDPTRVTDALAHALCLAERLETAVGLAGGMAICFTAHLLLRRRLHAQPDKETAADALCLADTLEKAVGLEAAEYICRVTCGVLSRWLRARSAATATEAATGEGGEPPGDTSAGPAGRPDTE